MVKWDSTPEDVGLSDGSMINVLCFGWLFNVTDLGYFGQWGLPHLSSGIYKQDVVRAEHRKENMGMVYLIGVMLCTWIVLVSGRLMSGAVHLIAYLSALFVGLGLRGLPVFVCDRMVHDLGIE